MKRLFALLVWAIATCAQAVDLTPAQTATLKAAIIADTNLTAQKAAHDTQGIADYLNATSTYIVWRSVMTPDQSRAAVIIGATQLDGLTAGKRDSLFYILSETVSPADPNVRAAIDDLCGSQNTLKNALIAAQKRAATRLEKVFATGTGTTATPGLLVVEGTVDELTIRRLAWSDAGDWLL
jgi:hypothetical protein